MKQELGAVHNRHGDIEQNEIGKGLLARRLFEQVQSFTAVRRGLVVVVVHRQGCRYRFCDIRIVFDDQNSWLLVFVHPCDLATRMPGAFFRISQENKWQSFLWKQTEAESPRQIASVEPDSGICCGVFPLLGLRKVAYCLQCHVPAMSSDQNHENLRQIPRSQLQVLIVDDDVELSRATSEVLVALGYPMPQMISSVEGALSFVEAKAVDFILLNLHMKQNASIGLHAAHQLTNSTGVPVFYFSAYSDDSSLKNRDLISDSFENRTGVDCVDILVERAIFDFERNPKTPLVLLVEDDPLNQWTIVRQLEMLGISAHCAANGREAVELFARVPYSLVLMDYQMPVMDGIEAARKIRMIEATRKTVPTPVLMVTAHPIEKIWRQCVEAGVSSRLPKPVTKSALAEALLQWLPREGFLGAESPDKQRLIC